MRIQSAEVHAYCHKIYTVLLWALAAWHAQPLLVAGRGVLENMNA